MMLCRPDFHLARDLGARRRCEEEGLTTEIRRHGEGRDSSHVLPPLIVARICRGRFAKRPRQICATRHGGGGSGFIAIRTCPSPCLRVSVVNRWEPLHE